MQPGHAEIVGGGFGGLVAATALAERGWSVRVRERRNAIDAEGYGIAVQPNINLIFRTFGICIPPSDGIHLNRAASLSEKAAPPQRGIAEDIWSKEEVATVWYARYARIGR